MRVEEKARTLSAGAAERASQREGTLDACGALARMIDPGTRERTFLYWEGISKALARTVTLRRAAVRRVGAAAAALRETKVEARAAIFVRTGDGR